MRKRNAPLVAIRIETDADEHRQITEARLVGHDSVGGRHVLARFTTRFEAEEELGRLVQGIEVPW